MVDLFYIMIVVHLSKLVIYLKWASFTLCNYILMRTKTKKKKKWRLASEVISLNCMVST